MRGPSLNSCAFFSLLICICLTLLSASQPFAQIHRLPPVLFFVFASHLGMANGSSFLAGFARLSARVLVEIPVDRDFIIYTATRTFFLPIPPGDFIIHSPQEDGRQR